MKKKLTVYQKPTCTKCRTTLRLLQERGAEFEAVNYFEPRLTEADLRGLLKKLGLSPREILRQDESVAKELGLGKSAGFSCSSLLFCSPCPWRGRPLRYHPLPPGRSSPVISKR
jgi:arsenate reductase-like glutaredoxin family protein